MITVRFIIKNEAKFVSQPGNPKKEEFIRDRVGGLKSRGMIASEVSPFQRPMAVMDQGTMGISTEGKTSLFSGGFSGCLGVIVAAKGSRKGGVIAHVSQTGNQEGKEVEYFLDAVEGVCKKWRAHFPEEAAFELAFFKGDGELDEVTGKQTIGLLDWESRVRKHLSARGVEGLSQVVDLREERELASDFLFDTNDLVLYLFCEYDEPVTAERDKVVEEEGTYLGVRRLCPNAIDLQYGKGKNAKMEYKVFD